jgi:hypothetical protein
MSTTSIWAGKAIENITESEYFEVIYSGVTLPDVKNCSLEQELNQVRIRPAL